jgi:DNA repair protein RecN (Recombination protein N)
VSLRTAARQVEELARYDVKFEGALKELESARLAVEDVSVTVRDYAGGIDASPERLASVEDRLALLDRLKRKYGRTLEEVIGYGQEVARKLDEIENRDETLGKLRREMVEVGEAYLAAARVLSRKRGQAARRLEKLVEAEIQDLAMKGSFKVEVGASENPAAWSASGFDQVRYLISTNPGEPLGAVEDVASGGELSRVMLALKAVIESDSSQASNGRKTRRQRTLVFDEIDTGIGGRAAEAVGKKLKALARGNQVLCITHLPQIASFADHHYLIEKREVAGRSRTTVRRLGESERKEEVARMLSGARLTDTSRRHAEQMLKANA